MLWVSCMLRLFFFFAWLEETEVHATVYAFLHEAGVFGKAVVLAMLEDEHAALGKHSLAQDEVGQFGQTGEGIGRIGEDEVEGVVALFNVAEHIGTQGYPVVFLELLLYLIYMSVVQRLALHRDDAPAAARHKLKADASGAGEEVEHVVALLQVNEVVEYVEEVLLGKVRRGACFEVAGHLEGAALVFSTDYSHAIRACRSKGISPVRASSVEWNSSAGRTRCMC